MTGLSAESQHRVIELTSDQVGDLASGHLCMVYNFDQGWSAGLVHDQRANPEDRILSWRIESQGNLVLHLGDDHLDRLTRGEAISLYSPQGSRYLIRSLRVDLEECTTDEQE